MEFAPIDLIDDKTGPLEMVAELLDEAGDVVQVNSKDFPTPYPEFYEPPSLFIKDDGNYTVRYSVRAKQ